MTVSACFHILLNVKVFQQILHLARQGVSEQRTKQNDQFGLVSQSLLNTVFLTRALAIVVVIINYSQYAILECGPMPNAMAALPNIGDALCSMLQSLADAHY